MIAFLKGNLVAVKGEYIFLDVLGVGYRLLVPASAIYKLPQVGENIFVYTYLHVREDAMLLFGFLDEDERELFEILQNVSGIGPKVALAIISTSTVTGFRNAILQDKVEMLTKIPGIGKKTAQRMILELKDKLAKVEIGSSGASEELLIINDTDTGDALNALVALGYNRYEAEKAIKKVTIGNDNNFDIENVIKLALKELARV